MTLLQAVILGIVQGLTEFLPVSSTAHLRIVPALFNWTFSYDPAHPHDPGAAFTAVIQLGTTVAIVIYFWRELVQVLFAWLRGLYDRSVRRTLEHKLGWYLILATIPISVFGVLLSDQIETSARNLWVIAVALIALAVVLAVAEKASNRDRDEEQIRFADAATVGTAQTLALIPGVSRSGVTITAGLFRGLTREAAARFSFLLSIPAVVLSGAYEARKINQSTGPGIGLTVVAAILAFIVGLASIHWLLRWLSKHSTFIFIGYRIGLGVALIVLLSLGTLNATK